MNEQATLETIARHIAQYATEILLLGLAIFAPTFSATSHLEQAFWQIGRLRADLLVVASPSHVCLCLTLAHKALFEDAVRHWAVLPLSESP